MVSQAALRQIYCSVQSVPGQLPPRQRPFNWHFGNILASVLMQLYGFRHLANWPKLFSGSCCSQLLTTSCAAFRRQCGSMEAADCSWSLAPCLREELCEGSVLVSSSRTWLKSPFTHVLIGHCRVITFGPFWIFSPTLSPLVVPCIPASCNSATTPWCHGW